jgi:thiol-disulfide isomerase/thioredoxin
MALVIVMAAGCAPDDDPPIRAYEARAIVTGIAEDRGSVVLSHEAIANYMDAMVMPFPLAHPAIVEGIDVGDEVSFQIVVSESGTARVVDMMPVVTYTGPFPAFHLATLDGELVGSDRLDGKVAIVNFWASWCAPCREEMPMLSALYDEFRADGLEIIGVTEDPENADDVAAQILELGVEYPIVMSDGELEEAVGGVFQIPTTFILNRGGEVVSKHIGLVSEDQLRREIESLF